MTCISTISVYDDLTSGYAGVTVWSTDDKTSGWVDEELRLIIDHILWKDRIKYIFLDIRMDLLLGYILVMLGRKHNCL